MEDERKEGKSYTNRMGKHAEGVAPYQGVKGEALKYFIYAMQDTTIEMGDKIDNLTKSLKEGQEKLEALNGSLVSATWTLAIVTAFLVIAGLINGLPGFVEWICELW